MWTDLLCFMVAPCAASSGALRWSTSVLSLAGSAISIWALIELGFLRGTPRPNRHGPDPLGA